MQFFQEFLRRHRSFLKKNYRYIAVLLVFFCAFCYQKIYIPKDTEEANNEEQEISELAPTLTKKNAEKNFSETLSSKKGDVFRVGFLARVDYAQSVDVLLKNSLHQSVEVGKINILPSEESAYHEVVFVAPGRYTDLVLRLGENKERSAEWDDNSVYISSFFLSRVDVKENEISRIDETKYGLGGMKNARLEDMGDMMQYSFSLLRESSDFSALFDHSADVNFDEKDRLITGSKKIGSYYTFRFDTINPYDVFAVSAVRRGISSDSITVQYSFDNNSWSDIPMDNSSSDQQIFSLQVPNLSKASMVYIRVKYTGEEKKSGTFSLEKLTVQAYIKKLSR